MAEVLIELGRGCPSTAWVTGVVATAKTMAEAVMGEQALSEAFAEPDDQITVSTKAGELQFTATCRSA